MSIANGQAHSTSQPGGLLIQGALCPTLLVGLCKSRISSKGVVAKVLGLDQVVLLLLVILGLTLMIMTKKVFNLVVLWALEAMCSSS